MTPKLAKFLVGGLTATILTAAVGGSALAQVNPQTPTPSAKPARGQAADAFLGALANKLGKSAEEVRAATVAAQEELVDQAAAAGRLTPEQATRLKQRIDQAGGRGALRGPHLGGKQERGVQPLRQAVSGLADFLKITPQQLGQELRAGKSLAQVAQDHGQTRDELKQYVTDRAKARLDELVKAGKLTQERANQMLPKLTANLDKMIDRVHKAPAKSTGTSTGKGASL
jgi:polyhydroxyalkanoate synthesis regulator phasin